MLMKKQEKQKQKIKEVLLKILHIVSYVLSLAFIGLCILTGVQSCSKPKAQANKIHRDYSSEFAQTNNNIYDSFAYSYTSKYTGNHTLLEFPVQENILKGCDSTLSIYEQYSDTGSHTWSFALDNVYAINTSDNSFALITRVYAEYVRYYDGHNGYYWRLASIYLQVNNNGDLGGIGFVLKDKTSQDGVGYNDNYYSFEWVWNGQTINPRFYCTTQVVNNPVFDYLFNENNLKPVGFSFNDKINYNAPFGYLGKNPLIPKSKWEELPHLDGALDVAYLDTCWFLCNGQLYNRILIYGQDAYNYYYHFGDNLLQYTLDHNLKFVEFIAFANTMSDYSNRLWVWAREVSSDYQGKYVIEDNGIWKSSLYRNITLLGASDTDLITFTQFNTDLDLYEGGITFYDNNVGVGGAFSLLRQAFSSLIDIMGISILPGITLGVFIFLPLIVTIIVLIFKAVRK